MHSKISLHLLLILLAITTFHCQSPQTETTVAEEAAVVAIQAPVTVYLVRHAEKITVDPREQDPELTAQGHARAESLRALLEGVPVDAIYVTKYKRSGQTLKPLADERQLKPVIYLLHDLDNLRNSLLKNHAGQTVVVAAHSNTLLPLLEQLGAKSRISHISETAFNYLFKVVVHPADSATLETTFYGAKTD